MKPGASNNDIMKMKKLHCQGYDVERISKAMRIELSCVKSHLGLDKAKPGIEGADTPAVNTPYGHEAMDSPQVGGPANLPPIQDEDAIPADLRGEVAAVEEQLADDEGQL